MRFARRLDPWVFSIGLGVIALVSLPYLLSAQFAGAEHIFAGFLFNPQDGFSYLAKMQQGWWGEWKFQLPFTAPQGEGAYLYLYYIALGHLSRLTGIPNPLVFHLARLLGAAVQLVVLWKYICCALSDGFQRRLAFSLAALGGGLGWLAVLAGGFTSDFWVAEAYPFLSAYANPHFPLGMALALWILLPGRRLWLQALAAFILGLINPFGVILVVAVLGMGWLISCLRVRRIDLRHSWFIQALVTGLAGGSVVLYDFWAILRDPILAGWNAQNVTATPPWWDLFLSFSPLLWLALPGAWLVWQSRSAFRLSEQEMDVSPTLALSLGWLAAALVMIVAPLGLQRRFLMGIYIPLSVLAAPGYAWLAAKLNRRRLWLTLLFALVLPTNLLVLAAGISGARQQPPELYLTRTEAQALAWMQTNLPRQALILAPPRLGLLIPAWSGQRVLYGHPFETVSAAEQQALVERYYACALLPGDELLLEGVNYVWAAAGDFAPTCEREPTADLPVVYQEGAISLSAWTPAGLAP